MNQHERNLQILNEGFIKRRAMKREKKANPVKIKRRKMTKLKKERGRRTRAEKTLPKMEHLHIEKWSELVHIINTHKLSIEQICIITGKSRPTINRYLKMFRDMGHSLDLKYGRGRPRNKW